MSGVLSVLVASGPPGTLQVGLPDGANALSTEYTFNNAGGYVTGDGIGGALTGSWVLPANAAIAANYEIYMHVVSGTWTSGPTEDTWLPLSVTRSWIKAVAGTVNFTVSFRQTNGPILVTETLQVVVT